MRFLFGSVCMVFVAALSALSAGGGTRPANEQSASAPQPDHVADSVALVVESQSACKARFDSHGPWQSISLGDEAFVGETFQVVRGAALTLAWHRGGPRFRLVGNSICSILSVGPLRVSGVPPERLPGRDRRVAYDPTDMRPSRSGILASATRSGIETVGTHLKAPLGATFDTRPRVAWTCAAPVTSVRISLYPAGQAQPAWSREVKDGAQALAFPEDAEPLEPGKVYRWDLDIRSDDTTNRTDVLFWVARPEVKTYLDALRTQASTRSADREDRLVLVRALWDAGRFADAVAAADSLARGLKKDNLLQGIDVRLKQGLDALSRGAANAMTIGWPFEIRRDQE